MFLDELAGGEGGGEESGEHLCRGVAGAAGDEALGNNILISFPLPLPPLLLLLGVVSQSLSLLLLGNWTPPSSLKLQ